METSTMEDARDNIDRDPTPSTSAQTTKSKRASSHVEFSEKCRVCKEPATRHLHYGAIVCFSCKAFFRRAIQNNVYNLFNCSVDNNCEMNGISRKHCQKCRWEACLSVGMNGNWVLSKEERLDRQNRRRVSQVSPESGDPDNPPIIAQISDTSHQTSSTKNNESCNEGSAKWISREASTSSNDRDSPPLSSGSSNDSSSPEVTVPRLISGDVNEERFIQKITCIYDQQFLSVSLGEVIIKEMIVSSLYNVPISVSSSLSAYRLMVSRVTKIANSFDTFFNLPIQTKMALLKKNADPMVLINGATFFSESASDQIKVSLGADDKEASMLLIGRSEKSIKSAKAITYWNWNSIQCHHNQDVEEMFSENMERLGNLLDHNPTILKVFSFVVLLCTDGVDLDQGLLAEIEGCQLSLLHVLERYLHRLYGQTMAGSIFGSLVKAMGDLRSMSIVNATRQFTSAAIKSQDLASLQSVSTTS
ncbi:vitamin D3 receptor-like isoform X2 [Tigriopus californicus]|uniref:vitamin D3 receptor-like isoform X2 n=1 Tax=Tigriopus californicus TaxID=6832 RepID=UPI0027D9F139|nr:vitamin D3 receptor-like isoform X2 [Tigriopus californicus]|eukprot:TCALIF_01589-PA protein Name:"Similar to THRA Thyroid hormone receptor alpha (Ovis aries)" AED:0.13 eAED:0.13 QI:72/1/0.5/1/0/0.5/2/0/474